MNVQRTNLLDSKAPNPSVETLLHAFLPHKFIDHTHSNAVLSLTDQPDGEALAADVFGKRAALVPYVMPGFALAKKTDEIARANPDAEGLVLLKHGIFSMGATAEEAYVRMIDLVTLAEKRLAKETRKIFPGVTLPKEIASVAEVTPILRGLLSLPAKDGGREATQRFVFEFRTGPEILIYVGGKEIARYSQQGPVTPDHAIRTKGVPLVAPAPEQASSISSLRKRRPPSTPMSPTITPTSRAITPSRCRRRRNSIRSRASCWCRASACSASATARRTRRSPPTSPRRP